MLIVFFQIMFNLAIFSKSKALKKSQFRNPLILKLFTTDVHNARNDDECAIGQGMVSVA